MPTSKFNDLVNNLVSEIPKGRVMTYGQIAAICDSPMSARIVGGIAHYGDSSLPWHRVVNKRGGLATGYPGGQKAHKIHLEAEGIKVSKSYTVDIEKVLWQPSL
jgi:methylated-DNA-protein-cysteine methyltransferase related protein